MNNKQNRKYRYIELEKGIKSLFESFIFESFSDCKDMLCDEITRKVKSANVFSQFGGKYKTILGIDPFDNYIEIDIKSIDGYRLMKLGFYTHELLL